MPPDDSPATPSTTDPPVPASDAATVMGRTRAEWDRELVQSRGQEYFEMRRGHLDAQWEYMVATFGDPPAEQ